MDVEDAKAGIDLGRKFFEYVMSDDFTAQMRARYPEVTDEEIAEAYGRLKPMLGIRSE